VASALPCADGAVADRATPPGSSSAGSAAELAGEPAWNPTGAAPCGRVVVLRNRGTKSVSSFCRTMRILTSVPGTTYVEVRNQKQRCRLYLSASGVKWIRGGTNSQCDRTLGNGRGPTKQQRKAAEKAMQLVRTILQVCLCHGAVKRS
jgi:hypothetical protein